MMMTADQTKKPLLEVQNLKQHFPIKGGILGRTVNHVKAVDDVSFTIFEGETLSIVGESGCGKSTTGRAILRLDEPTSGSVFFEGKDLLAMSKSQMRSMRKDLQVIFQDPFASLNPRQSVAQILGEALAIQNIVPANQRRERIIELLSHVGLRPDQIDRFPHEFSGGQRQRIGIARALAVNPKFVIADEPISALDVSVQAQVVNLMKNLQREQNLTYLFIAHDLAMVKHISDRIGVMYLGNMVEMSTSEKLYESPKHPYTQALLSAIPVPDPDLEKNRERKIIEGDVPSPINPPSGCVFRTRCPVATEVCAQKKPVWQEVDTNHFAACHLYQ